MPSASCSAWGRNPLLPVGAEELQQGMARIPQGSWTCVLLAFEKDLAEKVDSRCDSVMAIRLAGPLWNNRSCLGCVRFRQSNHV